MPDMDDCFGPEKGEIYNAQTEASRWRKDPNLDYCPKCGREVGLKGLCDLCKNPTFKIEPHRGIDKSFTILGPIELEVDYDDVPHEEQDRLSRKVVRILNDHWFAARYADQK